MSDFPVFGSEALLLGICLGEYSQSREPSRRTGYLDWPNGLDKSFIGILERRLGPFVPSHFVTASTSTEFQEIPNFAEWIIPGQLAVDPRKAAHVWQLTPAGWKETYEDLSRRSILDLVVLYLGDSVGKSKFDQARYSRQCGLLELGARLSAAMSNGNVAMVERGEDNPVELRRKLKKLFATNDLQLESEIGECLGNLFGLALKLEYDYCYLEATSRESDWNEWEESARQECRSHIEGIIYSPLGEQLTHSQMLFEARDYFDVTVVDEGKGMPQGWRMAANLRCAVSMALGELLQIVQSSDQDRSPKNAAAFSSRILKLSPASRSEKVAGSVEVVERAFVVRPEIEALQVFSMLINGIEALTKQAWPGSEARSVLDLLAEKISRGNELEKRFASIAASLYRTYRNTTVHDSLNLNVSGFEANYFINAMKALLDLFRRIRSEDQPSS